MSGRYLPSAQFIVIVASIALSGGLVLAAQYVTRSPSSTSALTSSNETDLQNAGDWKTALYDIQGTNPLDIQTEGSIQASLAALQEEASTTNITNNIGRSLLLNLTQAKSQGLGGDIPTQEKLVADAAQQLDTNTAPVYTTADLQIVADSNTVLRAYGNAVIAAVVSHSQANVQDTYVAVGNAVDNNDSAKLNTLPAIQKEYRALTQELLAIPVPQTLSPLHLQIINNFSRIAGSYADMQTIITDPLRGFAGIQTYDALIDETGRMFTNIAQSFAKNGILFDKDEPGDGWSVFLPQ